MPGVNWAKNLLLGKELTNKEMEDIPYPRLELHVHVMCKAIEVFISLLNLDGHYHRMVAAPVVSLIKKKPFATTLVKYGINGAGVGIVAGPILTEGMLYSKTATPESIWDRSYRLRHNAGQVRTDRYASFCALGGTTVTSLMGAGPLPGAVIGLATGNIVAGVVGNQLSPPSEKKPKPKDEEKKE